MEVVVVENIYLLVIITLLSVLQNGEERPLEQWKVSVFTQIHDVSFYPPVFFALKVEKECNGPNSKAEAFERVSCAK